VVAGLILHAIIKSLPHSSALCQHTGMESSNSTFDQIYVKVWLVALISFAHGFACAIF
jgi:hypothetical protein